MKKLLLRLILSLIVISGCRLAAPIPEIPDIYPTPTPGGPPKQVSAITLPFVERWRTTSLPANFSQYPASVVMAKEYVVVGDRDGQGSRITVFEAHTGNLVWRSDYINHLKSLGVSDGRVYVGTIRSVQTFDLKTGKVLWEGAVKDWNKKGFLYVYPTKEQIHVYDFSHNHLYLLDPETGKTLEEIDYPNIFFKQGDTYYTGCGYGYNTLCLDRQGPQIHWARGGCRFEWVIYLWPVFTEDRVFLNAGGEIYALDNKTGDIIWQSGYEFVSAPVMQDGLIYAIRSDATVMAFDPETGKEIGSVKMTPNRTIEDDGGYLLQYGVAVSDKFMAVYYGNSQELIVFEKVEGTGN